MLSTLSTLAALLFISGLIGSSFTTVDTTPSDYHRATTLCQENGGISSMIIAQQLLRPDYMWVVNCLDGAEFKLNHTQEK
jgi:hypothetical protein